MCSNDSDAFPSNIFHEKTISPHSAFSAKNDCATPTGGHVHDCSSMITTMCGAAMGLNESSDGSERRRKDVRSPSIPNSPERIFDTDFLPKLTRRKRRNISLSPTMVAVQD